MASAAVTHAATVATPVFSPVAGTYTSAQSVTISTTTSGASIRYTTNGTTPTTTTGNLYSGPLTLSSTTTLKAIAYKSGSTNSAVASGTYTIAVAAPVFSPAAGAYTGAQSVAITTAISGASIRYTTNGTTPTTTTGTNYSVPVSISATGTTLKAIAYKTGLANSTVTSGTYTIAVAAPVFSPAPGAFNNAQAVTITTATSGATIRYTTNGTAPTTTTGTVYSGSVSINATGTKLMAIAYKTGLANSTVTSGTYTLTVAAPTFSPTAGTYTSPQSVAITTTTSGASIRYTTNGTTPSPTTGNLYSGLLTLSSTTTLEAIAYETGFTTSAVTSGTYTIKTTPVISWSPPAPIIYGTALSSTQLNATANVPGSFVYNPPAGTILAAGTQTLSVAFTPTDATDYNNASASVSLTVNAEPVTFTISPVSFTYNGGAQGPTITPSISGATYSVSGTASATAAGSYSVAATATGNYTGTSGAIPWTIAKATPVISWSPPAPIVYGTALSSTQLNATANVPGSFVYNPPAGTILAAGTPTLLVAFTPTDVTNYANASASVSLTVNPPPPQAPVFNSGGGTYASAQSVTITSAGATAIYYTTDGSTPTSSSPLYSGPILIATSMTLQAIGTNSAGTSPVTSDTYTINIIPSTGMRLWLKGDAIGGVGPVSTWVDQSGNGNNATQGSVPAEPTLVTNSLNGLPVVHFSGQSQTLNLPNVMVDPNNPGQEVTQGEIFAVVRSTIISGGLWVWGRDSYGSQYPAGDGTVWDEFGTNTWQSLGKPAQDLTQFHVYNISSNSTEWTQRFNGLVNYDRLGNQVVFSAAPILGTGNGYFTGDIAEIIVYDHVLSSSERHAVEVYFGNKYNLNIGLPVVAPVFSPAGGTYTSFQSVTITSSGANVIYYTTDGSTPTSASQVYSGQISILTSETLQAIGVSSAGSSLVTSGIYTINLPPFTNTSIPGMSLWLAADTGVTTDANGINTWADQSGNGHNATQINNTDEPHLVTAENDSTVPNGRSVVRFVNNGAFGQSGLVLPNVLAGASGGEAFVVFRNIVTQYSGGSLWNAGTGGPTNLVSNGISDGFFSTTAQSEGPPNVSLSNFNAYDVSSQKNQWEARFNGLPFYSTGANAVGDRGATADLGLGLGFSGDVAEIIVCNQVLTQAQRNVVGQYLSNKYNLSIVQPAAEPVFNPSAGTYLSAQSVTITSPDSGVTIRYTTDGSTPTETNGTVYIGVPVSIGNTTLLRAVAYESGVVDSSIANATYTIQVVAPSFNPGSGTYTNAQSVTITSATSGATIRYTTDGSTPTETNGTVYTGAPANISGTAILKAVAYESGFADSSVTSSVYTLQTAPLVFSPAPGAYANAQAVTITTATNGATIRYTTDGRTPDEIAGTIYTGPVNIGSSATLQVIVYEAGFTDSRATGTYTLQAAAPVFSVPSGTYANGQTVTITSATSGATIRYTTDGSTPTETNGNLYSGPLNLGSSATLAAIAYASGFTDSSIASSGYTIGTPQVAAPVFSAAAGNSVAITTATSGATIRYTTDGSTPSETNGNLYSGPLTLGAPTTLAAIAYETGFTDSLVTNTTFGIPTITIITPANGSTIGN